MKHADFVSLLKKKKIEHSFLMGYTDLHMTGQSSSGLAQSALLTNKVPDWAASGIYSRSSSNRLTRNIRCVLISQRSALSKHLLAVPFGACTMFVHLIYLAMICSMRHGGKLQHMIEQPDLVLKVIMLVK